MPRYTTPIEFMIYEKDVSKMYNETDGWLQRVLISLCWLTGARTKEIIDIKKSDVVYNDNLLAIKINTLKLGNKDGQFKIRERVLRFTRPQKPRSIYVETIIKHIDMLKKDDAHLIPYGQRWVTMHLNDIGKRAIGKELTPYHFRHSICTALAVNGKSLPEIMHFKGAISLNGVKPYIHAKASQIQLEALNRDGLLDLGEANGGYLNKSEINTIKEYAELIKEHNKAHLIKSSEKGSEE